MTAPRMCARCVQLDTRPGVTFDRDGVCNVCRYYESKDTVDWKARRREFCDLVSWAKSKGALYDAVVPASGGKDSLTVAVKCKEAGLRCLLVRAEPFMISKLGLANWNNLLDQGFDAITVTANPVIMRKLIRRSFFEYGHIHKACEFPLYACGVQTAIEKHIPLVVWGEDASLELGDTRTSKPDFPGDASRWAEGNTVAGGDMSWLIGDGVTAEDLALYRIPTRDEIRAAGIRMIHFSHFFRWSQYENAQFAIAHGLKPRRDRPNETGRLHPWTCLDTDRHIVNQMLKFRKLGFGFATDEACYDIREGRLSRKDALELVKRYDGKCARKYLKAFRREVGITPLEFWETVKKFEPIEKRAGVESRTD